MSEIVTGRIGEFIAALRLEQIGVRTGMCSVGAFDLIACTNSEIYRIQVKSRSKPDTSRPSHFMWATAKGGKKEPLSHIDCDIVALVSIPHETVFFMAVTKQLNVTARIRVKLFEDRSIARTSWKRAMIVLQNYKGS